MAKLRVNFYLWEPKAKDETPIYLHTFYNNRKLKWYTGLHCAPNRWSSTNKRPKRQPQLSRLLDEMEYFLKEHFHEIMGSGKTPTHEELKEALNAKYKGAEKAQDGMLAILQDFIERNPSTLSVNTLKQYKTFRKHLTEFVEQSRYNLSFDTINGHFDEAFNGYLVDRQLSPSSINKVYGTLKSFMKYGVKMGFHSNMLFQTFERRRKPIKQIALTMPEVEAIGALELEGLQEYCRDVFLFSCETAMEFSALKNLKKQDLHEYQEDGLNDGAPIKYAQYYRQKNKNSSQTRPIAILSDKARLILERYDHADAEFCFPGLNNQVYNRYLKEIARRAGITETVTRVEYEYGSPEEKKYEKWELVSSHTARRTFATYSQHSDSVKRIFTGHTTQKQLVQYQKDSVEDKIRRALGERED